MSVRRFKRSSHQMTPCTEGDWVRYEYYTELEAENAKLKAENAKLEKALEQATVGLTIGKVDELDGEDYIGHKPVILVAKVADALELAAYLREQEDKR